MSSSDSSSSSSSSSDSDDDEITKHKKKDKRRAKIMRRESRSKLEKIKEEKERQQRSLEVKRRREYLEMKKKKDDYQRFLLEKQRNPNKEPIVSLLAKTRNRISNALTKRTKTAKKAWYNISPPRSYIEHGERQSVTPSIKEWRQMMGLPEPKLKGTTSMRSTYSAKGGIKSGKSRKQRRTMKRQRK
jgi:hypothetical protein